MRLMQTMSPTQTLPQSDPSIRDTAAHTDPAGELYDRSCDLLASALALRDAASAHGSAAAIPDTLGCIEASLIGLAETAHRLRPRAAERLASRAMVSGRPAMFAAGHEDAEFIALADRLERAGDQCLSTRERVGPLLAELSAI
jgi:hypothetical protein